MEYWFCIEQNVPRQPGKKIKKRGGQRRGKGGPKLQRATENKMNK